MSTPRVEALAEGHPELALLDDERESVAELLAEMLIEALGPAKPIEAAT